MIRSIQILTRSNLKPKSELIETSTVIMLLIIKVFTIRKTLLFITRIWAQNQSLCGWCQQWRNLWCSNKDFQTKKVARLRNLSLRKVNRSFTKVLGLFLLMRVNWQLINGLLSICSRKLISTMMVSLKKKTSWRMAN